MFMAPHDSQLILEAHFVKQGKKIDDVYFADRVAHPEVRFYTLSPESFALPELLPEGSTHATRTHFRATVFRGHLEKGGVPIDRLTDIEVQVAGIVHAHGFAGMDKDPKLTYIMFGSDQELLLAHFVSKPPDFDQIVSVSATGTLPTAEELRRGPMVEVPGRGNTVKDRLKTGETAPGRCHSVGAHQILDLNVTVRAELYFEEGELSSTTFTPRMMDQTKEEKKAGFD
jgi:hypothetical protein